MLNKRSIGENVTTAQYATVDTNRKTINQRIQEIANTTKEVANNTVENNKASFNTLLSSIYKSVENKSDEVKRMVGKILINLINGEYHKNLTKFKKELDNLPFKENNKGNTVSKEKTIYEIIVETLKLHEDITLNKITDPAYERILNAIEKDIDTLVSDSKKMLGDFPNPLLRSVNNMQKLLRNELVQKRNVGRLSNASDYDLLSIIDIIRDILGIHDNILKTAIDFVNIAHSNKLIFDEGRNALLKALVYNKGQVGRYRQERDIVKAGRYAENVNHYRDILMARIRYLANILRRRHSPTVHVSRGNTNGRGVRRTQLSRGNNDNNKLSRSRQLVSRNRVRDIVQPVLKSGGTTRMTHQKIRSKESDISMILNMGIPENAIANKQRLNYHTHKVLMEKYNLEYQNTIKAYKEGIFSAIGTGVSATYQGTKAVVGMGKDMLAMAKEAVKKLIEVIKKVLKGASDMIQKFLIERGNLTKKMQQQAADLEELHNNITRVDIPNDLSMDIITTRTLDKAGWNLSYSKNTGGSVNAAEMMKNQAVYYFLGWVALRESGESPEDLLNGVKSHGDLYIALNNMFIAAKRTYDRAEFDLFKNLDPSLKNMVNSIDGNDSKVIQYTKYSAKDYGRFVAQAFSPAGAYVKVQGTKVSWEDSKKNKLDFAQLITPIKETNIAGEQLKNDLKDTSKYIAILFNYITSKDVLDKILKKGDKLKKLSAMVDKLTKLTPEDIKRNKELGATRDELERDKANQNQNRQQNNQNNANQNNNNGNNNAAESMLFSPYLLDAVKAFGEDDNGNNPASDDFSNAANAMRDISSGKGDNTNFQKIDKDTKQKDQTNTVKKDQFEMNESDIKNMDVINKGLNYLQSYLQASGNMIYGEARIFNLMCGIMTKSVDEFIATVKKGLIDNNKQSSNVRGQNDNGENPNEVANNQQEEGNNG